MERKSKENGQGRAGDKISPTPNQIPGYASGKGKERKKRNEGWRGKLEVRGAPK
jgi:hypothetical protein